jgi:hypothetical protein
LIGLVAILAIAVLGIWYRGRQVARDGRTATGPGAGELARQANSLLVKTDDAVSDAQQEIGFAQAQFDESVVSQYSEAITAAQAEMKQAFALRQQLDDSTPEDPPAIAAINAQIVSHCQAAQRLLDAQATRLKSLSDLRQHAPDALAALPKAVEALKARQPEVRAAVDSMSRYAPSAWSAAKGNDEEAAKRAEFAEQQIAKGKSLVAQPSPDLTAAAQIVKSAQEALAQANQLIDAMLQMARSLDDAAKSLNTAIAAAETDITAAQQATKGSNDDAAAASLTRAGQLVAAATHETTAAKPDPIAGLKAAQDARAAADTVLAGVRQASMQAARAQAMFNLARAAAVTAIGMAQGYVNTHRDGVGAVARTRLSEAERHLDQADALMAKDVNAATVEASVACNMATSALTAARGDFNDSGAGGFGGTAWGAPGGLGS